MSETNLGDLQSVLLGAARCLSCSDPHCVNVCPEHVDVRAAMRLIVGRTGARQAAWTQRPDEAAQSVRDAIEASFK